MNIAGNNIYYYSISFISLWCVLGTIWSVECSAVGSRSKHLAGKIQRVIQRSFADVRQTRSIHNIITNPM